MIQPVFELSQAKDRSASGAPIKVWGIWLFIGAKQGSRSEAVMLEPPASKGGSRVRGAHFCASGAGLELLRGIGEIRVESQRGFQAPDCLLDIAQGSQCQTQVLIRGSVIRSYSQGLTVISDGLRVVLFAQEHKAQVVERRREVGVPSEGFTVLVDRLVRPALQCQRITEVYHGLRVGWRVLQRQAVMAHSFLKLSLVCQGQSQIVFSAGKTGFDLDGCAEAGNGFIEAFRAV